MANEYIATLVMNPEPADPKKSVNVPASGESVIEQANTEESPSDDSAFTQTYSYLT